MRICNRCNENRNDDEFKTNGRKTCIFCDREKSREYKKKHKDRLKEYNKTYHKTHYEENSDYYKDNAKKYRENNKEKIKEYKEINKKKHNKQAYEYRKKRMKEDSCYKLMLLLRKSIYSSLHKNNYTKKSRTHEILGCSYENFKKYIEKQFEPWMTWENQGQYNGELDYGWDLDHIIPISSASTEEEIIKLNHYTNFQPLCSKINRDIKKDKLDYAKNI